MLEKLSCKPKAKNPLKLFMSKKAFILIIIFERINIVHIKILKPDKRDMIITIWWWILKWQLEPWEDICQWTIWWWCNPLCPWWICKEDLWWEEEIMVECPWEVIWTTEEEWEEEEDNKELVEEECKPDTPKLWWIWCNLKCKDKCPIKDPRLIFLNNKHNNKHNSIRFNNLKII